MDGKVVKEKLKKCGIPLSEIAARMGYENDQRLHSQLKSEDVKTGLLEKICEAIGVDMSFFYPSASSSVIQNNNSGANVQGQSVEVLGGHDMATQLNKKDEQIDRLLSIIEKSSK